MRIYYHYASILLPGNTNAADEIAKALYNRFITLTTVFSYGRHHSDFCFITQPLLRTDS